MEDQPVETGAGIGDNPLRGEIDEIGVAIKAIRTERSWSLRKLASEAGVSASLLSAVETGKIVPTVASLFAVSDALGLPAESLFPVGRRPVSPSDRPPGENEDSAGRVERAPRERSSRETSEGLAPMTVAETATRAATPPGPDPPESSHSVVAGPAGSAPEPPAPIETPTSAGSRGRSAGSPSQRLPLGRRRQRTRRAGERVGSAPPSPPRPTGMAREAIATLPAPVSPSPLAITSDRVMPIDPPVPGFVIVQSGARPAMELDGGSTWTLVSGAVNGPFVLIEISMPPDQRFPSRFRTHLLPVELMVLTGRLIIEGGFTRMELVEGDTVTVAEDVPHRFATGRDSGCRFLWAVAGPWDGRI